MKIIYTLILLLLVQLTYSQADSITKSNVYILRATGFLGSARQFKVFVDRNFSCKIKNDKYLVLEVSPGKHSFAVQIGGKKLKERAETIEILAESGKNYYLSSVLLETGPMGNVAAHLDELSENGGQAKIMKLKRVMCDK